MKNPFKNWTRMEVILVIVVLGLLALVFLTATKTAAQSIRGYYSDSFPSDDETIDLQLTRLNSVTGPSFILFKSSVACDVSEVPEDDGWKARNSADLVPTTTVYIEANVLTPLTMVGSKLRIQDHDGASITGAIVNIVVEY